MTSFGVYGFPMIVKLGPTRSPAAKDPRSSPDAVMGSAPENAMTATATETKDCQNRRENTLHPPLNGS